MFKLNKKKLLALEQVSNTPLLSEYDKGDNNKKRIQNLKERVRIKKIKDINGMQITYEAVKRKN